MTALYRHGDGKIEEIADKNQIAEALKDKEGLIWLDIYRPTDGDFKFLEQVFGFHPLALEDSRKQSQRAKIEEYDHYFFMVVHAIQAPGVSRQAPAASRQRKDKSSFGQSNPEAGSGQPEAEIDSRPRTPDKSQIRKPKSEIRNDFRPIEIDMFVGPNYLVSLHSVEFSPVSQLIDISRKGEGRFLKKGSDLLLYSLVDAAVDTFFPFLERIDDRIDSLEDEVLSNPSQAAMNEIFGLKKELVFLRKLTGPQREIVNTLTSRDYVNINEETIVYFRDIYDHLVRIYDMLDSYRDLMSGALDVYLSTVSNRLNLIMQRLTIFAAIFMPITFITGVFGMNFRYAPQILYDRGYMFYWTLLAMAIVAGANIWWFRRNKWM